MAFYTFVQNNSGGSYDGPVYLCVEADTAIEANGIAQENGAYFDGVSEGEDCRCCGDRWYPCNEHDAAPAPSHYGAPFSESELAEAKIVRKTPAP